VKFEPLGGSLNPWVKFEHLGEVRTLGRSLNPWEKFEHTQLLRRMEVQTKGRQQLWGQISPTGSSLKTGFFAISACIYTSLKLRYCTLLIKVKLYQELNYFHQSALL
jgi:hypothetical protein